MATKFKTQQFGGVGAAAGAPMAKPMVSPAGGMGGGTMRTQDMPVRPMAPQLSQGQMARRSQLLDVAKQNQDNPVNNYMYRRRAAMIQPQQQAAPRPMAAKPVAAKPVTAKPKMGATGMGRKTVTDYTNTGQVNVLSDTMYNPKLASKTGQIPKV